VTLSGEVQSRDQRRRIEDCAESVSGVSHVQNNTRVNRDYSTAGYGSSYSGSSGTSLTNGSKSSASQAKPAGSTSTTTSRLSS